MEKSKEGKFFWKLQIPIRTLPKYKVKQAINA
jgi:hypothetical protein